MAIEKLKRCMKRFLDKLRGTPEILATVIVSFFSFIMGMGGLLIIVSSQDGMLKVIFATSITGASFGVFFTFILDMARQIMARPDLRGVPLDIAEEARNEVFDIGYYRANCKITIKLKDGENKNKMKLTIVSESDIFTRSDRVLMRFPDLGPSGESEGDIEYSHNGRIIHRRSVDKNDNQAQRQVIRLNKCEVIREHLEASRDIDKKSTKPDGYLEDGRHRWRSSVSGGVTVEARLPDQYQFQAFALVGGERVFMRERKNIEQVENSNSKNTFIYIYDDSFFSQQGVYWYIKKLSPA